MRWSGSRRYLSAALVSGLAGWLGGYGVFRNGGGSGVDAGGTRGNGAAVTEQIAANAVATGAVDSPSGAEQNAKNEWLRVLEEKWRAAQEKTPSPDAGGDRMVKWQEYLGEVDRVLLEAFEADPEAVLELIAQLPPQGGRERWLATVLKSFPPGALPAIRAWVARLPADHFRVVAVSAAVKQWASLDPEGAQAVARSCEGLGDFAWVRGPLLEDMDAEGQAAFVRTLSPQGQADFWSEAHVGMPAGLVAAEMVRALDRPALEKTAQKLFSGKARTNPLQALAAAQTLPDDGLRYAMCRTVVQHWSAEDSHLASRYAAALPAGALRDAAAEGLAIDLATVDVEAAARWAASIADAERRRATEARLAEAKPGPGAPAPAAGPATETNGQP